jgi:hypothetical protein
VEVYVLSDRFFAVPLLPFQWGDAAPDVFCVLSQPRTVSASGWIARVGAVSRSTVPVRSHRHIAVKSLPTNPKRSNSHTGIGKRRGFLPDLLFGSTDERVLHAVDAVCSLKGRSEGGCVTHITLHNFSAECR